MKRNKVIVSDHATVRWLERVYGIDIKSLHEEIISDATADMIKSMGDGKYPIEGVRAVVKDNVVKTIVRY